MLGIYFSVLDPDRHPSVQAVLAAASVMGTACGVCVYRQYAGLMRIPPDGRGFTTLLLGVFLFLFLFGFTKAGRIWIPVLFLFFSAFASGLAFRLVREGNMLSAGRLLGRALCYAAIYISAFYAGAQAMIYSRRFSVSRHSSRIFAQRASYFLTFILLLLISAAGASGLIFL